MVYITSRQLVVIAGCRAMKDMHTSTSFGSLLRSPATIICHQQAFKMGIYLDRYPGVGRKWWRCEGGVEMVGRFDEGRAFKRLLAELFEAFISY
jgi:hypothetical protein